MTITSSNNSNFNNVQVAFYTPCTVNIANQNAFSGQILGNNVQISNNATINFKPNWAVQAAVAAPKTAASAVKCRSGRRLT